MRDYKELVRELREADEKSMCGECGYKGDKKGPLFAKAADAIEELQKRVEWEYQSGFADGQRAANRKKNKWIPVTERQPEKTGLYLCYTKKRAYLVLDYSKKHNVWNAFDSEDEPKHALEVTHWMPLPEPPKEEI